MNVRCEKADGSQNPMIKSGLSRASIDKFQFTVPLPTRNAYICRSAEQTDMSSRHIPGDHQDTSRLPQYDRCNWVSRTGDL
jgi:hypothetical protein